MKNYLPLGLLTLSLLTISHNSSAVGVRVGVACASSSNCTYTYYYGGTFQAGSSSNVSPLLPAGNAPSSSREIHVCKVKAMLTEKKCKDLYQTLQPVCASLTGYFGVRLGNLFWEKALGVTLDSQVKSAMALGASTIGANVDDAAINCTYLTNMAMNYCEVGAQKMAEKCK